MQPAQPFGRRGVVAASQPRFVHRQAAAPQPAQRPEPSLASLGLERLGSAAAPADHRVLWMLFSVQGRLAQGSYRLVRFGLNAFAIILFWSLARWAMEQRSHADLGVLLFILLAELTAIPLWIWTTIAMQVKRWHDRDKSGVWMFIGFIPFVGPLWTFVELMFLPGTPGPNRFGPAPGGDTAAVFD
ncbi:DUF805 domain-containing protein [Caulobacter sp. KR2-114]|uniref:DUF805 domain-containing protein n=1 Tax=Caulobacter sp. KR2-114 TaxID=3400912 RepID=UPI003C04AEBE